MEEKNITKKRIWIFIAIAFGLSWGIGLIIYLTGGIAESNEVAPGTGITYALMLMTIYMLMPAIANAFTRIITKEGWKDALIKPNLKKSWQFWLIPWLGIPLFIIGGMAIYFLFFPGDLDITMMTYMENAGLVNLLPATISPMVFASIQFAMAVVIAPVVNGIPVFGEEFGWRGYLQPKLMKLFSPQQTMLLMGGIWGVWHWPVIFMGYNYGFDYVGAPFLGPVMMVIFCFGVGTLLGWATYRAKSVWPAVIGHAVLNGTASIPLFFLSQDPRPLLGPFSTGLIGGSLFLAAAAYILLNPGMFDLDEEAVEEAEVVEAVEVTGLEEE